MPLPKLALRQLVRWATHNWTKQPYVYFRGRVHIVRLDHNRTLCGRSNNKHPYSSHHHWEPPEIPIADCVKCLDNYEKLNARATGGTFKYRRKLTRQIFIRETETVYPT